MKRSLLILLSVCLCALLFAGCGEPKTTDEPSKATEAPTEARYLDTPIDEPEWTLIEGKLTLEDTKYLYAEGDDFLYFAIVGATTDTMELRFRLNDGTAEMLSQQSPDNSYFITFNGERIGKATLTENCTVAVVKSADAEQDITFLATEIRGLNG